ncbi:MAG: protein phosphatase 2C domain-containing protein [Gemmataceae bacterium]
MTLQVNCPHCQQVCQLPEGSTGSAKCGRCGQIFTIPATNSSLGSQTGPQGPSVGGEIFDTTQKTVEKIWSGISGFGKKMWDTVSDTVSPPPEEIKPPGRTSPPAESPTAPPTSLTNEPPEDFDEIDLELDGPGAGRLFEEPQRSADAEPTIGADPPPHSGVFRLDIGRFSSAGRVRDKNEDSHLVQHYCTANLNARHEAALIVVADGMGGYQAGDRASLITIQAMGRVLGSKVLEWINQPTPTVSTNFFQQSLIAGLHESNTLVLQEAEKGATSQGMGSTAAVAVIYDGVAEFSHVGDCRVNLWHDGQLEQLTRDHTLVGRMVELGQLTEEEAENHPHGHQVTQGIGKLKTINPSYSQIKLTPGDWLIVACDGLHAHVNKSMLTEALRTAPSSAPNLVHYLVDLANFHGGSDNCTVVAVRCF